MKYSLYIFSVFFLLACSKSSSNLEHALEYSGSNRPELEKVLQHYQSNPADSLKYRGACFLIENMPEHFSLDTTSLHSYRPILQNLDSISYLPSTEYNKLEEQWKLLKFDYPFQKYLYQGISADIHNITSEFLIRNIDLSFEAWKNNPYRDSISFDDFCGYCLTYRKERGLAMEDWRSYFQPKHIDFWSKNNSLSIFDAVDSLMYQYKSYRHSVFILDDYPFLKMEDLLLAKRSLCGDRCWFNTMVLSSVGIPSTVDCVPAWANRHNNHSWNTILYGGTCYPFEPFWDYDHWKYKSIYNNETEDDWWGDFRLPKVFRYSYENQKDIPAYNLKVKRENIPSFFQNPDLKDVSKDYFIVQDVTLKLENHLDAQYAYLCVFNAGQWKPVHWGKYSRGKFMFKDMGCEIVYMPTFYSNGNLIPAGQPFILHLDGSIEDLSPSSSKESIKINQLKPLHGRDKAWGKNLVGGKIQGANHKNFSDAVDLISISEPFKISLKIPLAGTKKYRYIRYLFPNREVIPINNPYVNLMVYGNIAEFTCYENNKNSLIGNIIQSGMADPEKVVSAFDGDWQTFIPTVNKAKECDVWIGLDFGSPKVISEIELATRNEQAFIYKGLVHELFYWNKNQWHSLGRQKATSDTLEFENVPTNALLWLRCIDKKLNERIFTYKNGKQVWW